MIFPLFKYPIVIISARIEDFRNPGWLPEKTRVDIFLFPVRLRKLHYCLQPIKSSVFRGPGPAPAGHWPRYFLLAPAFLFGPGPGGAMAPVFLLGPGPGGAKAPVIIFEKKLLFWKKNIRKLNLDAGKAYFGWVNDQERVWPELIGRWVCFSMIFYCPYDVCKAFFGPGPGGALAPVFLFGPGPGVAMAPVFSFGPGPGISFWPRPRLASAPPGPGTPGPAPGPGRHW